MSDKSIFESRYGNVSCSAEDVYRFVTDIRNFERFVRKEHFNNWRADKDSCSFNVPMIGTVNLRVDEKEKFRKVIYSGDALKKNDFSLLLEISEDNARAGIRVILTADLNPMMKMVAAKPIEQFLEKLIAEMEKFSDWTDIRE